MSILDKIIFFVKNIFHKEEIKMIEETTLNSKKEDEFIKSLKVKIDTKIKIKKLKTLICYGDGLGIQKNIKY